MGVFDSTSSSNQTSQNAGQSEINGPATSLNVQGGGKKSVTNVQLTDAGAVQGALAYAREASLAVLDFARETQLGSQTVAGQFASASKDSVSAAYALANQARQSETSGALNNFADKATKYGMWIAVAALVAWVLVKRRG